MAERRMFTQKIIDSDAFLDMPLSSQSLYFHLNMRADDDGFVNNPKKIQRMIGASEDDLKLLLAKRFILGFESGIVVIKHWRMHNLLRKDRYNPTQYIEEMSELSINENGSYTEKPLALDGSATTWQPNGNQMATQYRIDKDSIVKDSEVEDNIPDSDESPAPKKKQAKQKYGEYQNVLLTDNEFENLANSFGIETRDKAIRFLDEYIEEKGYKSKSHNLAIRRWVIDAIGKEKKTGGTSFSANDFFQAAIQKTQAEMKREQNPPKTAGEDPSVRQRAEELKRKIGGVTRI